MSALSPKRLAEIRERTEAATPGPWFWWGNTDNHNTALCGRQPGLGVCEVISTIKVDRSTTGREADANRSSLRDVTDLTEEEIEEQITEWAIDSWSGEPRSDERLAITSEKYIRHAVEEVAVYQVARAQGLPEDTPRDHEKVYRADICDVRTPNGRFLANSRQDVEDLVAEVGRLRAGIEALHRPVHPVFSWKTGLRYEEPCPDCHGKAGVHPCGCWADEDMTYECAECATSKGGGSRRVVPWPCETAALLNPTEGETE